MSSEPSMWELKSEKKELEQTITGLKVELASLTEKESRLNHAKYNLDASIQELKSTQSSIKKFDFDDKAWLGTERNEMNNLYNSEFQGSVGTYISKCSEQREIIASEQAVTKSKISSVNQSISSCNAELTEVNSEIKELKNQ